MRQIRIMTIILLVLLLPVWLLAARDGVKEPNQIWLLLAPIIATIVTSYGVRLFKWLGIPIEEHLLYPVMMKLIEIIAGVEESFGSGGGSDKKDAVIAMVHKRLSAKEIKILSKRFGNIDTAVQAAFEMSSVARR